MTDAPKPGIYPNIPFADYLALPGVHKSDLFTLVSQTPAHYRYRVDHSDEFATDAKDLGRKAHALILEPEVFKAQYVMAPQPPPIENRPGIHKWNRTYKEHKAAWADFLVIANGREVVEPEEFTILKAIRDAVFAHPTARELLKDGQPEVSVVWTDLVKGMSGTGDIVMPMKARIDWLHEAGIVIDIKTCRRANPTLFGYDAYKYGYGFQAAFYLDGLKAVGVEADQFIIIAVETEPPYCVAVYQLNDDENWLTIGRDQYRGCLQQVRKCMEDNAWPGYSDGAMSLPLPSWAGQELAARIE